MVPFCVSGSVLVLFFSSGAPEGSLLLFVSISGFCFHVVFILALWGTCPLVIHYMYSSWFTFLTLGYPFWGVFFGCVCPLLLNKNKNAIASSKRLANLHWRYFWWILFWEFVRSVCLQTIALHKAA